MYRVIDLSRLLPGPYATLCLQGLGMSVTKVEDPEVGDYLRHIPPLQNGVGIWFEVLNRGKRSVTLNLKREEDRLLLREMLKTADVLVESFRPGVMRRLGLDPLQLRREFPRLVIASLTGWGQDGPMSQLPGHDLGFMCLAGMLDGETTVPKVQWGDLAAGGLVTALKIAGALLRRQETGEGDWLDIAMLDGLIGLQPTRFANLAAGEPLDELLTGGAPQYGLYRCADGEYVSVAALEGHFYEVLAEAVPAVTEEHLRALFASAPRDVWMERLGGACVVPRLKLAEVSSHPQVATRRLFDDNGLPHPPTGPVHGRAPGLGEHNETDLVTSSR